ncbi:MAG: PorV/PorQ family protein [Gemmatimonadetes bacterium]|nr:PorV/PorQ family protein [Gemmatimonadota bacterium]
MRNLTTLLMVCLCMGVWPASVQATPESRAGVLFLLIEPGARAVAMGESYVAVADDATAGYFNPASLVGQSRKKMHFTHSKWLPGLADDLSYEFLAYSMPIEGGGIGFNVALMNLGEQTRTGERGEVLGTFRSHEVAVSAAYGAQIGNKTTAGISLKFIRSSLAPVGAGRERGEGIGNSFAADLGFLWRATPDLSMGMALRNLGPKIAYIDASQADPLPQHIVVGVAYEVMDTQYNDLLLSCDLYKPLIADGSFVSNLATSWADESLSNEFKEMDLRVGGEYQYGLSAREDEAFIALRAGISLDRDGELNVQTFGLGLKYNRIQIDVAYVIGNDQSPMDDNVRYSMNLLF